MNNTLNVFQKFNEWWKGGNWIWDQAGNRVLDKTHHNWDAIGGSVPGWYFAIIMLCFVGGLVAAIILGAYLNGAKWINKKNFRIEGQEFVRSNTQKLVYRTLVPVLGVLLLFVGYLGSVDGTLNIYKNAANNDNAWLAFIPFFRSQSSFLYQCNIASIFVVPWLIFFNKTKALAIVAPFTFLGATSTVFSREDLADGNWFNGFEVHRKAIEHIMLMVVPLFVLVANRYQLTTKSLVGSTLYIIIFNAIVAFAVYFGWHTHFENTPNNADFGKEVSAGEFFRAAQMIGKTNLWVAQHFWITVVFILGPITFCLSLVLWLAYNFVFYASTNKIDPRKIKRFNFKKIILFQAKTYTIAGKKITLSDCDFGQIVSSLLWFFQVLGLKIASGPTQFVKQFKQTEKDSWNTWLSSKKWSIISK